MTLFLESLYKNKQGNNMGTLNELKRFQTERMLHKKPFDKKVCTMNIIEEIFEMYGVGDNKERTLATFITEQIEDVSYGRLNDGGSEWVYFNVPSPGSSNSGGSTELVAAPPDRRVSQGHRPQASRGRGRLEEAQRRLALLTDNQRLQHAAHPFDGRQHRFPRRWE